jgi:hypothetical protein
VRNQDLGFIPDWEKIVTPVVEYVLWEKKDVVERAVQCSAATFSAAIWLPVLQYHQSAAVFLDGVWNNYPAYTSVLSS